MKLIRIVFVVIMWLLLTLPVEASPKVIFYNSVSMDKIPGEYSISPLLEIDMKIENLIKENAYSERAIYELTQKLKGQEASLKKFKDELNSKLQLIESNSVVMQVFYATGDSEKYIDRKSFQLDQIEQDIVALQQDIDKEMELISSNKDEISSLFLEREKFFNLNIPILNEEDISAIVKELEGTTKVVFASSNLLWPLKEYGLEWISAYFGIRDIHPITKEKNVMHHGIDIAIPIYRWPGSDFYNGAPVFILAASDGVAYKYESSGAYGNYVVIVNDKHTTLYAHVHEFLIKNGQAVRAGEPIAVVGSTGMSTNPHLHFEVWINGEPVDPLQYLKGG